LVGNGDAQFQPMSLTLEHSSTGPKP
jgi:hypothetical protein